MSEEQNLEELSKVIDDCQYQTREFLDHFRIRENVSYIRVVGSQPTKYGFPVARLTYEVVMPVLDAFFTSLAQRDKRFRNHDMSDLFESEPMDGEILVTPQGELGQEFLEYVVKNIVGYGIITTESESHVPEYVQ